MTIRSGDTVEWDQIDLPPVNGRKMTVLAGRGTVLAIDNTHYLVGSPEHGLLKLINVRKVQENG